MTFTPYIPTQGIAGWNFLQSTYDRQFDAFTQSGTLQNDTDYFLENIGNVQSSDDLLNDRRLLQVAVKAFGLEEEIDYRALLQRVLNEGTAASDALANTMDDARYVEFSNAFGFGSGQSLLTADKTAMQDVVDAFHTASFEEAVGTQDETMRTALFARRSFPEILGDTLEDDGVVTDVKDSAVNDFLSKIGALNEEEEEEAQTIEEKWSEMLDRDVLVSFFDTTLEMSNNVLILDDDEKIEAYIDAAEATFGSADPAIFFASDNAASVVSSYESKAAAADVSASEIAEVSELSNLLLGSMVAEEAEINDQWSDLLKNSQMRSFFEVAFNLSDTSSMDPNQAIELVKAKSLTVFGSEDPRDFASESNVETTLETYKTIAEEAGLTSSEIARNSAVAEAIFSFSVPEPDTSTNSYDVDAKWYAIMGQGVMPGFFETAFDLDSSFENLSRSEQLATYKAKAMEHFATEDPEEVLNSYNATSIFDLYRTNSEAAGDSAVVTQYYIDIAERELNLLFPTEEEGSIDDLLEDIFGDAGEDKESDIDTMWFTIMGQQALTDFMQVALGLPEEVGQMDVDQALEVYKNKANQVLGTEDPSVFANAENMDSLVDRYLARAQIANFSSGSSNNYALMILG